MPLNKIDKSKPPKEYKAGRIFTPSDGGVFVEVEGWKYPVKGYPMETAVENLAVIKGLVPLGGFILKELLKYPPPFTIIAFNRITMKVIKHFAKVLRRQKVKNPKRYCRPVREIFYAFNSTIEEIKQYTTECTQWIQDIKYIVCIGLEFDNAYRYRIQHAIQHLDQRELTKHPIREFGKMMNILIKNENLKNGERRWKYLKFIVMICLLLNPKLKNVLVEVLSRVDKEKLRLDDDDWYLIAMRNNDYNFRG